MHTLLSADFVRFRSHSSLSLVCLARRTVGPSSPPCLALENSLWKRKSLSSTVVKSWKLDHQLAVLNNHRCVHGVPRSRMIIYHDRTRSAPCWSPAPPLAAYHEYRCPCSIRINQLYQQQERQSSRKGRNPVGVELVVISWRSRRLQNEDPKQKMKSSLI